MSEGRGKVVTINDVAKFVGLAKGTVSRALNGYPDIAERTRQRVTEAALQLGYRPSNSARTLKRGIVDTVGIIIPAARHPLSEPFFSEFLDGVCRKLDSRAKDLLVASAPTVEASLEVFDRLITSRKVDGFIVGRTMSEDPRIAFLQERGFPFVAHGRSRDSSSFAWYDIDSEEAFFQAVATVAELGHRRIGYVGGPAALNFARLRLDGYRRGLAARGLPSDPALEATASLDPESGRQATESLLALDLPPTAILCCTDPIAFGALAALRAAGLEAGKDVTVIGYDGLAAGDQVTPPLTTFAQGMSEAGEAVAEMLLEVIAGAEPASLQRLEPARLVRRESDGPPRRSPEDLAKIIGSGRKNL